MADKEFRRVCHNCGKEYTYFPGNPDGAGLRRCADCMKLPRNKIVWRCPCGQTFKSRDDFYNHRREMKANGKFCGNELKKEITGTCPFCGKAIRTSKNKYTLSECYYNHTCEGVELAKSIGVSLIDTIILLDKMKNASLKNKVAPVEMDRLLQLSWVQSVYEKYGLPQDVCLSDNYVVTSQRIFSYLTKSLFIFDGNILPKYKDYFKAMNWNVFEFKWTDCILHSEDMEKKIVDTLKEYEKK